jgi:hypothetical protein
MAHERKIGGTVFRCEELPAVDGLKLFKRASKLLGPDGLAAVRDGLKGNRAAEEFLVMAISQDVDGEELIALMVALAEMCTVGSDPCVVGVKPTSMIETIEVAFFCLEVQFKDFLGVALASNTSGGKSELAA